MKKYTFYSFVSFFFLFIVLTLFVACKTSSPQKQKVIVIKYATHPALDELEENFISSLKTQLESVEIERFNANGSPISAKQLAETASHPGVDLIVTLGTPVSQAVAKTPSNIPLLYAAVSDPEGAHIVSPRSTGIRNVDSNIVKWALQTIKVLYPKIKSIGTIYNPTEQNSIFVQNLIKYQCDKMKIELVQRTVTDPTQYQETVEQLRSKIGALYCANDNTVNKGVLSIARTAQALGLPFFIGELSAVYKGAIAGVGVEYASMGKHLGELAKVILLRTKNEKLPPNEAAPQAQLWLNMPVIEKIGLIVPQDVLNKADKILK